MSRCWRRNTVGWPSGFPRWRLQKATSDIRRQRRLQDRSKRPVSFLCGGRRGFCPESSIGGFGRSDTGGQDRIDGLFRRHLQIVDRHCCRHVGDDVRQFGVIVALSAGGERRRKIRENPGNDGHYSPCRLSYMRNVVGRFIAKPPPCPPPAWVARREGLS